MEDIGRLSYINGSTIMEAQRQQRTYDMTYFCCHPECGPEVIHETVSACGTTRCPFAVCKTHRRARGEKNLRWWICAICDGTQNCRERSRSPKVERTIMEWPVTPVYSKEAKKKQQQRGRKEFTWLLVER